MAGRAREQLAEGRWLAPETSRRLLGLAERRSLAPKLAAAGAVLALTAVVILAPFGAGGSQVSAACPPGAPGGADDPPVSRPLRTVQIRTRRSSTALPSAGACRPGDSRSSSDCAAGVTAPEPHLRRPRFSRSVPTAAVSRLGVGRADPRSGLLRQCILRRAEPPSPPGLVDIDGWETMPYTVAAQSVQVSAFPDAYARQENTARDIAEQAGIDLNRAGDPYAGRTGPRRPASGTASPGSQSADQCGGGLIEGRPIAGHWPAEVQAFLIRLAPAVS